MANLEVLGEYVGAPVPWLYKCVSVCCAFPRQAFFLFFAIIVGWTEFLILLKVVCTFCMRTKISQSSRCAMPFCLRVFCCAYSKLNVLLTFPGVEENWSPDCYPRAYDTSGNYRISRCLPHCGAHVFTSKSISSPCTTAYKRIRKHPKTAPPKPSSIKSRLCKHLPPLGACGLG